MVLLRLLADILIYTAFGLIIYWYVTSDTTALWIAIGCGVFGILLIWFTADIRPSQRQRRHTSSDMWDWLYFIDILEIPFYVIGWLFRGLWRIFD
ncbi:hypothetical protein [Psychrobacter sp. DM4]|uniref:hypothetical protein n=1 Tax=Psychrobacter sp. DM4 TaxID=3440637 RepID=UPI003F5063B3